MSVCKTHFALNKKQTENISVKMHLFIIDHEEKQYSHTDDYDRVNDFLKKSYVLFHKIHFIMYSVILYISLSFSVRLFFISHKQFKYLKLNEG
jgi:hypothetical protein